MVLCGVYFKPQICRCVLNNIRFRFVLDSKEVLLLLLKNKFRHKTIKVVFFTINFPFKVFIKCIQSRVIWCCPSLTVRGLLRSRKGGWEGDHLINEKCLIGSLPGTDWCLRERFPEDQWATTNSDWTKKDSRWEHPRPGVSDLFPVS